MKTSPSKLINLQNYSEISHFCLTYRSPVPKSLQSEPECCVIFSVKDKGLLGLNKFMGEVFLSFQQIIRGDSAVEMQDLEQIILPLTKPSQKGKSNIKCN